MSNARQTLKDGSHNERILAWLASGKSRTSIQAIRKWGCTRLAARRLELVKRGHDIRTHMRKVRGARVAVYRLVRK